MLNKINKAPKQVTRHHTPHRPHPHPHTPIPLLLLLPLHPRRTRRRLPRQSPFAALQ